MKPKDRAAKAFGAWRERIDRGERVDLEDVIREHPELADDLRSQLAAMRRAERLLGRAASSAPSPTRFVGRTLGRWRLASVLGSGGMGTVFEAADADRNDRPPDGRSQPRSMERVAVKVLHPHLLARRGFVDRFLREAEIGRRVRHANVVATLDAGAADLDGEAVHYLVMELVEGRTLRDVLGGAGRAPESLCRDIGRETARALAAIHAAGAVHRDLKPENVIVVGGNSVKVMDLGVARLRDEAARLSHTGAFVGSVQYGAPEQFTAPETVDARADLHALGLVLYELSTGVHPYHAEGFRAVVRRVLDEAPRPAAELNPQLSPFFEEVVATLLAKDREKRFAAADEVAALFEAGEESAWWRRRAVEIRTRTRRPLRRIRIPRETALYGREEEIARLRSLYERASAGEGQVAIVEGEAGIGKSRLVDEFVASLVQDGEDVNFLYGSYPPGGAATAAGAFSTAYREHLGDDEASLKDTLREAPLLVPAFSALLRGDALSPQAVPLTKDSLQTVFVHATRSIAATRPTIVLIDDLHFAPDEGRALFAALAHAVPGHRVLLVGAARPGLDEKWLAQVGRLGHVSRLALPRLSPKDLVRLLADSLRSARLAEELAGKIATKSDGNPFFVFEILRGLREGQFLKQRPDGTWATTTLIAEIDVPSSVVDLVQARVSDLSRGDRDVLEVASCVGFEFDPTLIGDVLSMERIPLLQSLGAVEKSHRLVRSVGRRFVFDHHQVMEVLYAGLSEPLREAYHAAIGTALETRAGAASRSPDDLDGGLCAALFDHLLKGGRGPGALRYLDAAVRHYDRVYLRGVAVEAVDRALAVPGLLVGRRRCEVLLLKASRLEYLARRAEERVAGEEAMSLADAEKDVGLTARTHLRLGRHFLAVAKFAEAEPYLVAAADLAHAAGDLTTEGLAVKGRATISLNASRYEEAERLCRRQLELCEAAADRSGEMWARSGLGLVLSLLGRRAESLEQYGLQLAIARELSDRGAEAVATAQLGHLLIDDVRLEEAEQQFERALAIHHAVGDRRAQALNAMNLGAVVAALGRMAEAMTHFETRRRLCEESGDSRGMAITLVNQGDGLRTYGRHAEARGLIARGMDLAREVGVPIFEVEGLIVLAAVDADLGDAESAERRLTAALELCRRIGMWRREADLLVSRGALLASRGRTDEARADLDAAMSIARDRRQPCPELLAVVWLARLPGGDVRAAERVLAAREANATVLAAMEARHVLWQATGDRAHLVESKRRLDFLVANAPAEFRSSMLSNVPLHRAIAEAARENDV
jgi:predicted ATPase